MSLSAKVEKRFEIAFFEGEIIPSSVTSYLLASGRLPFDNITLGEEDCR
jgi:hypothetical protein